MRRLLLFCVAVFSMVTLLFAGSRTADEAFTIAKDHFQSRNAMGMTRSEATPVLVTSSEQLFGNTNTRGNAMEEAFYIFNAGRQRFVIVSADDQMKPVLGYSDNGPFITESIPEQILSWLWMYVKERETLAHSAVQTNLTPWASVNSDHSYPEQVEPLLGDIKWNQSTPYNDLCPVYDGERLVTGCVATAMAMVLKYHNYPETGVGQNTYTSKTLQITSSFDFGATTFDWNNMLPTYAQVEYSDIQSTAVATLMKACGVAVDMDYNIASAGGSGATSYSIVGGLINYFRYDSNIRYLMRDYYSSTEWMNLIKKELSEKRPILYGGSSTEGGHQFVFDGYDEQDMVHVNWGWDGQDNGYFEITALNPASPGIGGGTAAGGGFVYGQDMVIGIQKPTADSEYVSQFIVQSSVQLSSEEVNKGGRLELLLSDFYNMGADFDGNLAVLLVKEDATIVLKQQAVKLPSLNGWRSYPLSVNIPASVPDGNYTLCIATKGKQESGWSRIRAVQGVDIEFDARVEGDQVTFAGTVPSLELSAVLQAKHALYNLSTGDFVASLTNHGSTEYYGQVSVVLIPLGGSSTNSVEIAMAQVCLEPNQQQEVALTGTVNAQAGNYSAYLAVDYGDKEYLLDNPITVTVNPQAATASGVSLVSSVTLPETNLEEGEKLTLQFQLECTGGIYDNSLYAFIFAEGQTGTSNIYFSQKVFLEAGRSDVVISGLPDVAPGTYHAVLCYMGNNGLVQLGTTPYFVIAHGTGVEEHVQEQGFKIYPQPAESVLNISSDKNISRIEVVNVSGGLVKQEEVSIHDGETYALPVDDLTKGCYILILHSEDKIYREKFIKK